MSAATSGRFSVCTSAASRQCISIARAPAPEPKFQVCDEPTSALDVLVEAQALPTMQELEQQHGLNYFSRTPAVVLCISDRVGVMHLGRLVELADQMTLLSRRLHPCTQMLVDAI